MSSLHICVGETTGTAILILPGGGVVAAVALNADGPADQKTAAPEAGPVLGLFSTGPEIRNVVLSPGGPTGYAINPFRDLAPRIHAVPPLPHKGGSERSHAWIPVLAPLASGASAGGFHQLAFA